jgi:hypothetical protein
MGASEEMKELAHSISERSAYIEQNEDMGASLKLERLLNPLF